MLPYCFECESYHASDDAHKLDAKSVRRATTRREARARLLTWLEPGSRVVTRVVHVSRSGMQREVTCSTAVIDPITKRPEIIGLDYWIARLCDDRIGKHGGIVVGGCGFDAGFQIVYNLGMLLWPNGTDTPHGTRNREPDSCGGYALKQDRW